MRTSLVVVMLLVSSVVYAQSQPQPQPEPYPQPQPQPYPQPQPQPQYSQPYGYAPRPVLQYQLTVDEQFLLDSGYISDGQWIGGAVANWFVGFGVGQAIQGRWSERGWIFTLGESASIVAMIYGATQFITDCNSGDNGCHNDRGVGLFVGGLAGYAVFHVWSIVDALVAPRAHNRKLKQLHMRLGMPVPSYARVMPYVTSPKGDQGGAVAGLSLRF